MKITQEKSKPKSTASRPMQLSEEKIVDSGSDSDNAGRLESRRKLPLSMKANSFTNFNEKRKAIINQPARKAAELVSISDSESATSEEIVQSIKETFSKQSNEIPASHTKRTAPNPTSTPPRKKVRPTPPIAVAPKVFQPPSGFQKSKLSRPDHASGLTQLLSNDLTGKQIWHITAPANVNIREITSFSVQDVLSGKPVFSKNGVDYGFMTGSHQRESLLLANGQEVEYTPASTRIHRTYHLREMGRRRFGIESDSASEEAGGISFVATSTAPRKKPREQPTGLRMRYEPYGSTMLSKSRSLPNAAPTFHAVPELPESQFEKSERKRRKKEAKSRQLTSSQSNGETMDIDITHDSHSNVNNPSSGTPAKSASDMADMVFEAASISADTPSQTKETKRKKKKHRIPEEETQM